MASRTLLLPILFALALTLALPTAARAAVMSLQSSNFTFTIGELPTAIFPQNPDPVAVAVSSGTGSFAVPPGLFAGTFALPTEIFTGVSLFSSLNVVATNSTISVAGGVGTGAITGLGNIGICGGLINLLIPLNLGGGGVSTSGVAALQISVTFASGWTTGVASVTGIITPTIGGGLTNTATLSGFDNRTAGHAGTIMLVTPARFMTNATGALPIFGAITLTFVPEPGLLLLLSTAAGGLALFARSRL